MNKMLLILLLTCTHFGIGWAQTLIIPSNIFMGRDSLLESQFITSLNGFFDGLKDPIIDNQYILKKDVLGTSLLIDELRIIIEAQEKEQNLSGPYLSNWIKVSTDQYLVQYYFLSSDSTTITLKASFNMMANLSNQGFQFYSTLNRNTKVWQKEKEGNRFVLFEHLEDSKWVRQYLDYVDYFDHKLSNTNTNKQLYYFVDDFHLAMRLFGMDYNDDLNGYSHNSFTYNDKNGSITINGNLLHANKDFDPHDLWHSRLRLVLDRSITNKSVDEGCAFLYAGSWGYSWEDIYSRFINYMKINKDADFLMLYQTHPNIGDETGKALRMDYILNAFVVDKIERELGFGSVMDLLSCGKNEEGNANYFSRLDQIFGINESNFHIKLSQLVENYKLKGPTKLGNR